MSGYINIEFVTAKKLSELTGLTLAAIEAKRRHNVWSEGVIWFKALDNRIYYSLKGYNEWVLKGSTKALGAVRNRQSKLTSTMAGKGAEKESNLSPPPLT